MTGCHYYHFERRNGFHVIESPDVSKNYMRNKLFKINYPKKYLVVGLISCFFVFFVCLSCSKQQEKVIGVWRYKLDDNISFYTEVIITKKTYTHRVVAPFIGSINTYEYNEYETGGGYIVLKLDRERDSLIRIDILGKDAVRINNNIYNRVED